MNKDDIEKIEEINNDEMPVYFQNFINTNLKNLTQIYINERKNKGTYGILLIEFSLDEKNVDVGFLPEENMDPKMCEEFKRRNINNRIMHIMCHEKRNADKHYIVERML